MYPGRLWYPGRLYNNYINFIRIENKHWMNFLRRFYSHGYGIGCGRERHMFHSMVGRGRESIICITFTLISISHGKMRMHYFLRRKQALIFSLYLFTW